MPPLVMTIIGFVQAAFTAAKSDAVRSVIADAKELFSGLFQTSPSIKHTLDKLRTI